MKKILQLLFVGIIGLSLNSCYYDEVIPTIEDPIIIPPGTVITFRADIAPIFVLQGCTASSCHGGSVNPALLSITSETAFNTFVASYVVKGNASGSKIYNKISTGSHFATYSSTQLTTMRAWIESDAKY